jgi:putative nucleotidyltransferase with HDIG domain
MQELDDYISKVKHLPPAPRVLPRLMSLLGKVDIDTSQVVEAISFDPALTAKVLQMCNSAYFASSTPASDLQEAITRLGYNQIYRTVVSLSGVQVLAPPQKGYGIAAGELWRHAVATAIAAQKIAEDLGDEANLVFTAALLHDIGKIVLADALEHIYTKLIEETETNQYSLLETEKKLLGVQHAEIGGRLLAQWKFPANLVAAVWFHHQPEAAAVHERLASYVYLGNLIAHFMGFGYGHQAFALRGRVEALKILHISPDQLPRYMIQTFEGFEAVESLFRLSS